MNEFRVALYLRVSTEHQDTDLQLRELQRFANSKAWKIHAVYEDRVTGTTANRPQLKKLMAEAGHGAFSAVLVWKLDRFARSLKDLLTLLDNLSSQKIAFVSVRDNIDLTTPAGRLMVHMLGAFSEFEASLIRERVRAGLANAKAKGRTLGRPKLRNDAQIRALRAGGVSIRQIANQLGIAKGSVQKALTA